METDLLFDPIAGFWPQRLLVPQKLIRPGGTESVRIGNIVTVNLNNGLTGRRGYRVTRVTELSDLAWNDFVGAQSYRSNQVFSGSASVDQGGAFTSTTEAGPVQAQFLRDWDAQHAEPDSTFRAVANPIIAVLVQLP